MEARMECLGTQNHKTPETRTLDKKNHLARPQEVGPWTPRGVIERTFFDKNHNNPGNRPYGAPGLQNDSLGLKNDRQFANFAYTNQDSCSQANKEIRAN